MNKIMYGYGYRQPDHVAEYEIIKETAQSFTLLEENYGEKRQAKYIKRSTFCPKLFETKQEAIDYKRKLLQKAVESAQSRLAEFNQKYPENEVI